MEASDICSQRTRQHIVMLYICIMGSVVPTYGLMKIASQCFVTNFVTLDLTCDAGTMIHVLQVVGGYHTDNSCTVSMNTSLCNEVVDSKWIFTPCNGKSQCEHEVLKPRDFNKCKTITAAQVKYSCVNNTAILDMCTDVSLEQNTSNSVIYLKSPGFPDSRASNKECTCIVKTEGNFMRFQILDLSFLYNVSKSEHPSFTANSAGKTLWDTEKERNLSCPSLTCSSFKKQKLDIANGQNHVQIFYNNKNRSQQNLWIEIAGHPYKLMTLDCNAKISDRTSGQTTSETDNKDFVIAIAVVAAIVFILLTILILVWFVRRHRKKLRASSKHITDINTEENHEQRSQNDGLYELADGQPAGIQSSNVPIEPHISQARNYVNSTELGTRMDAQQLSAYRICNGDYVNSRQDVQLNEYDKPDPPASTGNSVTEDV